MYRVTFSVRCSARACRNGTVAIADWAPGNFTPSPSQNGQLGTICRLSGFGSGGCSRFEGSQNALPVRSTGGWRVSAPANQALARETEAMRLELQEANRRLREA